MKIYLLLTLITICNSVSAQSEKFTVHFEFDRFRITTGAKNSLDSFLSTDLSSLKKIDVFGHCDSAGSNSYNDILSVKRVTSVKNYLIEHGLQTSLFGEKKGLGKRQPLNQNLNAAERARNRRVEIVIERKNNTSQEKQATAQPETQVKKQTLTQQIEDTSTKTGTHIVLKNLNFLGGRHFLMPQSVPVLTELLTVLNNNPQLAIEIQGHVCCTIGAEDGFDQDMNTHNLSVNRAKAIYQYLIEHGIDPDRLSYKGFGHSMPLVYPEDTEERKMLNRRVEIKIVKK